MGAVLAGFRRDIEASMGIETEQLVCSVCGARYPGTEPVWLCACGGLLDLDFQPVFDRKKIESRPPGLWRYREMLPQVADEHLLTLGEGSTPLVRIPLGGRPVLVKQDQLFPTGSYKERGRVLMSRKGPGPGGRRGRPGERSRKGDAACNRNRDKPRLLGRRSHLAHAARGSRAVGPARPGSGAGAAGLGQAGHGLSRGRQPHWSAPASRRPVGGAPARGRLCRRRRRGSYGSA